MSGAIFSLAVCLMGPAERGYSGAEEVPSATPPDMSGEAPPVPAPAMAPPPEPEQAPAPAPAEQGRPATITFRPSTPKWWGPFPRPKLTGFGGPVAHLTGLNRKFALLVGLAGGVTIRQRVSIGAMVMWLVNPADAGTTDLGARQRLSINYGGVRLGIVAVRKGRLDLSLAGLIGGGGACLQSLNKDTCYQRTSFFLAQPSVAAHVRLLPVVRLVFEVGYRFMVAKGWSGPSGVQLAAPVGAVMIELGWF